MIALLNGGKSGKIAGKKWSTVQKDVGDQKANNPSSPLHQGGIGSIILLFAEEVRLRGGVEE